MKTCGKNFMLEQVISQFQKPSLSIKAKCNLNFSCENEFYLQSPRT